MTAWNKPVRHTCGAYHSPKHRPHCTPAWRAEEGCWCFLYEDRMSAREWRAKRRQVARHRRLDPWWGGKPTRQTVAASWAGMLP